MKNSFKMVNDRIEKMKIMIIFMQYMVKYIHNMMHKKSKIMINCC